MSGGIITFAGEGQSRIEISKSVFIGNSREVTTSQEAEAFVAKIRSAYPDARHVCYAWRISGQTFMQKYSDDGEPSGTAGMPILNILTKQDISNAVITVTRYFGGILLGKGGLVRAYTEAAAEAARASSLTRVSDGKLYRLTVGYDISEKLIRALEQEGWTVSGIDYGENVAIKVTCEADRGDALTEFAIDRSFGRAVIDDEGTCEIRTSIPQI